MPRRDSAFKTCTKLPSSMHMHTHNANTHTTSRSPPAAMRAGSDRIGEPVLRARPQGEHRRQGPADQRLAQPGGPELPEHRLVRCLSSTSRCPFPRPFIVLPLPFIVPPLPFSTAFHCPPAACHCPPATAASPELPEHRLVRLSTSFELQRAAEHNRGSQNVALRCLVFVSKLPHVSSSSRLRLVFVSSSSRLRLFSAALREAPGAAPCLRSSSNRSMLTPPGLHVAGSG